MKTIPFKSIFGFTLISSLLFSFCGNTEYLDIKEYYFPIEALKEGKVYEYRISDISGERTSSRYKYYMTVETDSGKYFVNNNYDPTFFNDQYVLNEIVENGILIKEYHMMALVPEKEQQIVKAEIVRNNAFPFEVRKEGGVTPMEMRFLDPRDEKEKIRFIRERKYLGDTTFTFKGVDLQAVIFAANEIREFTHEDEGDFDNTTFATEIYAKGLGLVSRKYNIGDVQLESLLYDTFSMKKLENLASQHWGKEIELK
jgi:hypothetical protein